MRRGQLFHQKSGDHRLSSGNRGRSLAHGAGHPRRASGNRSHGCLDSGRVDDGLDDVAHRSGLTVADNEGAASDRRILRSVQRSHDCLSRVIDIGRVDEGAAAVDQEQATITIEAVGPGGPSAIPILTDIPLGPGAVLTIDLVAPDALGQELIVNASNRVFIERSLERGGELSGRSGSWALPASDF